VSVVSTMIRKRNDLKLGTVVVNCLSKPSDFGFKWSRLGFGLRFIVSGSV